MDAQDKQNVKLVRTPNFKCKAERVSCYARGKNVHTPAPGSDALTARLTLGFVQDCHSALKACALRISSALMQTLKQTVEKGLDTISQANIVCTQTLEDCKKDDFTPQKFCQDALQERMSACSVSHTATSFVHKCVKSLKALHPTVWSDKEDGDCEKTLKQGKTTVAVVAVAFALSKKADDATKESFSKKARA